MTPTKFGILIGAILALTWSVCGFWSFLFVAVAMTIGALIGRAIDGKLHLATLLDAFRGKRSSS